MITRKQAAAQRQYAKRAAQRNDVSSLLLQLPTEILVSVLTRLSARELAVVDTVCKRFCTPCEGGGGLSPVEAAARERVVEELRSWEERGSNPVSDLVGTGSGTSWKRVLWWYVHQQPSVVKPSWVPSCSGNDQSPVGAFRWKIDRFSSLANFKTLSVGLFPKHLQRSCFFTYSAPFMVGCLPWRLMVFPRGNHTDHLSIYLDVPDSEKLPGGWTRFAAFQLVVVNQFDAKKSIRKDTRHHFNARENDWGFTQVISLANLTDTKGGFLVKDSLILEVEIDCRIPAAS
mmetsp:Transcript_3756/g.4206  ORF Transcript_3756/g.4206 Transcript_3756/m.4206 type:complete len:287 (+) Transcript_3756:336-1196(+)|eukprot:CAMPEP_0197849026 /NCGR_PEP_ID=MMETSP1438-20131217/10603_1 /TAXON_ID=1461541 /ORGANISM="Pterosperma sp., Strain CCMP1384" /LENGTH=286 /DNA_ID=CAMNT_0043461521 /DNA_START=323 /DNA_END=1183 /DNA_ORIENTATION=+